MTADQGALAVDIVGGLLVALFALAWHGVYLLINRRPGLEVPWRTDELNPWVGNPRATGLVVDRFAEFVTVRQSDGAARPLLIVMGVFGPGLSLLFLLKPAALLAAGFASIGFAAFSGLAWEVLLVNWRARRLIEFDLKRGRARLCEDVQARWTVPFDHVVRFEREKRVYDGNSGSRRPRVNAYQTLTAVLKSGQALVLVAGDGAAVEQLARELGAVADVRVA